MDDKKIAHPINDNASVYKRMFDREREARRHAEHLLEEKSRALYDSNQELTGALAKQRREAFYQQVILDSVKDGILTIGSYGRVQTANPSACHIFGYEPEALIGIEVSELLATTNNREQPKRSNHFLADYCTSQQPVIAAIGRAVDGSQLMLELSASYGEVDDDALITWVVRDVAYIDAVKRHSNLSQRLQGIGELAAGIAHEINTPIQFVIENTKFFADAYHVINQVLEVYQRQAGDNQQLKEAVETICPADQLKFYRDEVATAIEETKAGASRIGEIVAAIKEFAHPGTEASTSVNLNDLVATAVTVTSSNCKYVANVDRKLDPLLPTVSCLRGQITQVMVNLIVNAADAILEKNQTTGEATGTIMIETGHDDEYVFFSVSDTGTGIDQDNLEDIFVPFFTTKDVGKGTGQGLAITHAIIVENHHGKIDIESALGQGSRFIIRLPRAWNRQGAGPLSDA